MKEQKTFKTESKELLNLMINSIYSNKEIFLRELISNASDAIDKHKFLALQSAGEYQQKDYEIRITTDKKKKWIQVSDNGIGMEKEDLEANLGTIARSGTKEFLAKYKEMKEKKEDVDLIGQFGVGFYSAFMVAKRIDVFTRSVKGNSYIFSSDGVETYTIEDDEKPFLESSGTAIRVYLKDDTEEEKYSSYLEEYEIKELVRKYSDFIRYPIRMICTKSVQDTDKEGKPIEGKYHDENEDTTLNSMIPLWKKPKKDVTDDDLNNFYKSRFMDYEDPLLALNIKAEGTLEYSSLIYIPKHIPYNLYAQDYEKGLALYAKGIFIEEKNKSLVPDYLKFMKGLIDSEDLQLNISREMLQKSPLLDKIAKNIEKKVLERLKQLKDEDFDKYLEFFKNYGDFLKFGIYSSYGMKKEELQDLLVFDTLNEEKPISLKTYKEKMPKDQKNIYFASGKTLESIKLLPEMARYKKLGYDVLLLPNQIDEFTLSMMNEYDKIPFKNITSAEKDDLSSEEKKQIETLVNENKGLLDAFKEALNNKVDEISFALHLEDSPVCISTKEGLSLNMEHVINSEMEAKKNPEQQAKAAKVLELNPEHPFFKAVKSVTDPEEIKLIANVYYDEAMMLEGFEVEDKVAFIENLNKLMLKAYTK